MAGSQSTLSLSQGLPVERFEEEYPVLCSFLGPPVERLEQVGALFFLLQSILVGEPSPKKVGKNGRWGT